MQESNNTGLNGVSLLIYILLIVLGISWAFAIFQRNNYKDNLEAETLVSRTCNIKLEDKILEKQNEEIRTKNILEEWIYKNSKHISRSVSKDIAINILNTQYPLLIACIIKAESNFNPSAISSKGAIGLGQIMRQHEKRLIKAGIIKEFRDIYNIYNGIKATEYIWKEELNRAKGDVSKALKVYVGGDNQKYINQIMSDFFKLHYKCKYQEKSIGEENEQPK